MKKNTLIITLVAICGIAVIIAIFTLVGDKNLDINSKEINDLYNKLGEVDINHCGGLNTYSNKYTRMSDISLENRLCMAYYQVEKDDIKEKKVNVTSKNKNDTKICKIGEITLSGDDNDKECIYEEIDANVLKKAYKSLYGTDLKDDDSFYTSATNACYKEGEKYLCGRAETFKMSIAPESNIYRVINKAIKKINDDIIIEDMFLKISGNICYPKQNSNEQNSECSKVITNKDLSSLNDDEIIDLVKKYGLTYKHTFKKSDNNNYYWDKTELKDY